VGLPDRSYVGERQVAVFVGQRATRKDGGWQK
jgi:hypothetical protein